MKILIGLIGIGLLVLGGFYFLQPKQEIPVENGEENNNEEIPAVTIAAENLEIPWDIAFLPASPAGGPGGDMLVTERVGRVTHINTDGEKSEIEIDGVKKTGEGGLLGILLHPDFSTNHLLYLYMSAPGTNGGTQNRVVRYTYENNELTQDKIIISGIPGAVYHDGGRMEFGPDGLLYITTGDATQASIAQDKTSLGGKILRLKDDGAIPADNPFKTAIYSYGHRNPQGLAWDAQGRLWETEHGPSGEQRLCCRDEVNLIKAGANYGWPTITGSETRSGMETPILNSGTDNTWAPASLTYFNGSLYFGGLMGEALYEARLDGEKITGLTEHFKEEYGRIRTTRLGPDGMLYITTSNRDGRGNPDMTDDRIIRVDPSKL